MRMLSNLTIGLLLFVLWTYHREAARTNDAVEIFEQRAERFQTSIDLTGKVVPRDYLDWLDDVPGVETAGESVAWRAIWIVDANTCVGCLSDLQGWNQLNDSVVRPSVVLMGVSPEEVVRTAAAVGLRTPVVADPGAISRRVFPFRLGSLRLLTHTDGTILFVDARNPAATCYWSFADVITRLTTAADARPILDDDVELFNPYLVRW